MARLKKSVKVFYIFCQEKKFLTKKLPI